jgi:hypothetical protein
MRFTHTLKRGQESLLTTGGCSSLGDVRTCTESGLPNRVTRFYRISAVTAVGEGPLSLDVNATTSSPPGPPRNLQGSPALAFSAQGTNVYGGVTLRWEAPSDDGGAAITNYRVWRNPDCAGSAIATAGNVLTYTDSHADLLHGNYYCVKAQNAVDFGTASNPTCAYTYPWIYPLRPPLEACA